MDPVFRSFFTGGNGRNWEVFPVYFLLLGSFFLFNPYLWRFNGLEEHLLISRGCLGLGIMAVMFLFPGRFQEGYRESSRCFRLFLGGLFLFTLFQWYFLPGASPEDLGEMELFLLLPLLSFLFPGEIRKTFGKFLALLGVYQLFLCTVHTPFLQKRIPIPSWHPDWNLFMAGITGNANWTSSLLILTLPFLLFYLHGACRKCRIPLAGELPLQLLVILPAGYFLYKLASVGSLLAFVISMGGCFYFLLRKDRQKYVLLAGGICILFLLTILLFVPGQRSVFQKAGNTRVRLELLWTGSVTLLQAPFTGYGNEATLEGALTRNRDEGYFLTESSAVRTNHPHNEILMRMLLSGIPAGLLYFCFLFLFPLWKSGKSLSGEGLLRERPREEQEKLLYFWGLLFLFLHGQMDLTLFAWPLREFSLLLLGLFWRESFCRQDGAEERQKYSSPLTLKLFLTAVSLVLLFFFADAVRKNGIITHSLRSLAHDREKSPAAKIEEGKKAVSLAPKRGDLLYKYMLYSLRERRWEDALFFAERFPLTFQKDYARNHGFHAQILARMGRWEEAFFAWKKDAELFPLAVLPIFNMIQSAPFAKKQELLPLLREELERRKKYMRFTESDFQAVLQNRHDELRRGSR